MAGRLPSGRRKRHGAPATVNLEELLRGAVRVASEVAPGAYRPEAD